MKAIILAAGKGTRLGKYTRNMPKCMLRFQGKPLIEWQVETLRNAGIKDIVIVKGYQADKIEIDGTKSYVNKDYAETNMVETLFTAEKEMNDEILVLYADILYEERVIRQAIESKADIGIVADKDYLEYWKARLEDYKKDMESFVIKNGVITELGEATSDEDKTKYRYVGILRFSKRGVEILKEVYHKNREKYFEKDEPWRNSKSFKKAYMTCLLQAIIDDGYKVEPIIISHGWMEFDTTEDYEKAARWVEEGTIERFIKI